MKNSLKFLLALCLITVLVPVNAKERQPGNHNGQKNVSQEFSANNSWIKANKHVYTYIPRDVKGSRGIRGSELNKKMGSYSCDEDGNLIPVEVESQKRGGCLMYASDSTKTSWIIRYVRQTHGPVYAEQVFEVRNGNLELWAAFDPKTKKNVYASNDAQKFASRNGRTIEVAQSPGESTDNETSQATQPARENCAGKNFFEKAACELKNAGVENAVGTIINNSR